MYTVYEKPLKQAMEDIVEDFYKKKEIKRFKNFEIVKAAQKMGFKVFCMELPEKIDGIVFVDKEKMLIGVSNKIEPISARFVVAHELSHYIINSFMGKAEYTAAKDRIWHNPNKSEEENIMDYMAAATLVPKKLFLQDMEKLEIKGIKSFEDVKKISTEIISQLALEYNVSEDLIERRILEVS